MWNALVISAPLYLLALAAGVHLHVGWLTWVGIAGNGIVALLALVAMASWLFARP